MKTYRQLRDARRQFGMTLVELLIALALSLALLVALSSVYIAVKQSFRFQENTGRLQEDAVFALDLISRELRMAGFAGCYGIQKVVIGSNPPDYYPGSVLSSGSPNGFTGVNPLAQIETTAPEVILQPFTPLNFIRGFDSTVPTGMVSSTSPAPSTTSDSLFFSGGSMSSVAPSTPMVTSTSPLTIAADTYGWATATANSGQYDMIVSDCTSSSIFKGKVGISGGITTIAHDTGLDNSVGNFTSNYLFGTNAIVMLAQWNYFYIATRAGSATPSLYRVVFNGNTRLAAEEVISNVESMQLHYGENTLGTDSATGASCILPGATTCVPNLLADQWRTTTAAVTDWSRVVAVRVGLMVLSAEDKVNPEVTQTTPTLLGLAYTLPAGASANRLRKEFSTTVVLRNRVAAR